MGVTTTNFAFQKPTVGNDDDVWGDAYDPADDPETDPSPGLSGNWEKTEALFIAQQQRLDDLEAEAATIPDQVAALQIQVNGLYASVSDTNPAATLGYGTWVAWGLGRALVGVGSNGQSTWTADQERGAHTHVVTTSQMPAHSHTVDPPNTGTSGIGNHTHSYESVNDSGATIRGGSSGAKSGNVGTVNAGSHSHTIDIAPFTSNSNGSNQAHVNEQPGTGVYLWRRTA